jgi:POT family proton-dependent oligopeptide transporter
MAVYMLSIPGGFIADRYLGAYRSVLIGGAVIALGHFTLAIPTTAAIYAGLALVALGTGLFKPNISALVGSLYARSDERRDAGFSIFYMGVNLGAFFAPLVTGFLAQSPVFKSWLAAGGFDPSHSWHWGFGAAGVGMTLGLIGFLRRGRQYAVQVPPASGAGSAAAAALVVVGTAMTLWLTVLSDDPRFQWLRALLLLLPTLAVVWFARASDVGTRRFAAVFVFFIASMLFWAVFEQAGTSISLFGDQLTSKTLLGWSFPSAWYQALNALFVILLAPLFAWSWLRLGARQPSSPVKFVLGLAFLGLSFLLMVPAALLTAQGLVSPLWLVALFFVQTVGELFLSPVGLSTMTKLAPPNQVGLLLGIWFLAAAWGNKLAGILGGGYDSSDPQALASFFLQQAAMLGVAAVVLLALVPWLKGVMGDVC